MKNLQNITLSFKLSKSPLGMCAIKYSLLSYLLFTLQWIWILKRFFATHGLGPGKPGPRAAKPITPRYVENNCRIEVKITFMLIAYQVLLCEFFWEFSIFHFCRPLVDIYWHPLLKTFNICKSFDLFLINILLSTKLSIKVRIIRGTQRQFPPEFI